jgi:hypothetical protein
VDILLTGLDETALVAKAATRTTPGVFISVTDPVRREVLILGVPSSSPYPVTEPGACRVSSFQASSSAWRLL